MSRSPYTPEFRAKVSQEYLDGLGSYESLAWKYCIGLKTIRQWVAKYRIHGVEAFIKTGNTSYSSEFKVMCVKEVLSGEGSIDDIVAKHNISSRWVLCNWVKRYNANMELKDYNPSQGVYMAGARRNTTLEERKEIVGYCIAHEKDYKSTAVLYNVSYNQVYNWVRKYLSEGEKSLVDNRGRRKTDGELDELEQLRRENLRLKGKLEEQDRLVELLKKVKEFERM